MLSDIFLRLIKMIIGPLVFCTLVAGIAKMGTPEALGRIGAKALACGSSALGDLAADRPGDGQPVRPGAVGLNLPLPDAGTATNLKTSSLIAQGFRHPPRAEELLRGDGQQRDPADRRLRHLLRRRR
ncbi:MAG: cation:dicarboxylase symporter family transporter [Rhodospirillales bacterium]